MTKSPRITGKQMISALKKAGFEVIRRRGSHHFLKNAQGQTTVVPVHSGETLGQGLISKILRDCELTAEQLNKFL